MECQCETQEPTIIDGEVRCAQCLERVTEREGLAAIVGQWPGDEDEETIAAALEELS